MLQDFTDEESLEEEGFQMIPGNKSREIPNYDMKWKTTLDGSYFGTSLEQVWNH